jgi:hypothetical protein
MVVAPLLRNWDSHPSMIKPWHNSSDLLYTCQTSQNGMVINEGET